MSEDMTQEVHAGQQEVLDFAEILAQMPTAYLVLDTRFHILYANAAYQEALQRTNADLVGRYLFDAFPPMPEIVDQDGSNPVLRSFERARDTGQVDQLPLMKYDIMDLETNQPGQRYWSVINAPVLDAHGRTVLLIQRAEDVTDYVTERDRQDATAARDKEWRMRVEAVEADLYVRAEELRTALHAQEMASRRLTGLAEAALALASASSVQELAETVSTAGFRALGADGGAIAVRSESDSLHIAITDSLGEETQHTYADVPLASPLPAATVARTGEVLLLSDRKAGLAWSPVMEEVYAATGRSAWAALPLRVEERILGSLCVCWTQERPFSPDDVDVLHAFAAQCAQTLDRLQTRAAEERAAHEIKKMSEALQRSLLTDPPQQEQLEIAVRYLPAGAQAQVGGDWYDAFLVEDGSMMLVVGDVAGHDQNAAASMAQMRNVLRGVAQSVDGSPGDVLRALDRTLANLEVDALATAVLGQITPAPSGGDVLFRWSNAGHLPPLLLLPDGAAVLLDSEPDLLLGFLPHTGRGDHQMLLPPGSIVVLYTDGLVEQRGENLEVGLERLRSSTENLQHLSTEEILDHILAQLEKEPLDDVALLAVRQCGSAAC